MTTARTGRRLLAAEVGNAEDEYVEQRRDAAGVPREGPVVGLALSGGGIRAATATLGTLQAMADGEFLAHVDVLSTVSGGGYTAACFSTSMHDDGLDEALDPADRLHGEAMPLNRRPIIHHLRRYSSYLVARRGMLGLETLRAIGSAAIGTTVTVALFLLLFTTALSATFAYATHLVGTDLLLYVRAVGEPGAQFMNYGFSHAGWGGLTQGAFAFGLGVLVALLTGGVTVARQWPHFAPPSSGETGDDRAHRRHVQLVSAVIWLCVLGVAPVAAANLDTGSGTDPYAAWLGMARLFWPLAFCLGIAVTYVLIHLGLVHSSRWNPALRSVFSAMHGLVFILFGASSIFLVLTMVLLLMPIIPLSVTCGVGITAILLARFAEGTTQSLRAPTPSPLRRMIQGMTLLVFLVASFLACSRALQLAVPGAIPVDWLVVCALTGVLAMALSTLGDFNQISLHHFYADRLAAGFLRTNAHTGKGLEPIRDHTRLALADLHQEGGVSAPLHLFVGAVNLAGSKDLARRDRKADHFVFSSLYCGSTTTGYVPTSDYRAGRTTVARAMAISGAAMGTGMGIYTSATQALSRTLFNLRLGWWINNPRFYASVVYGPEVVPPEYDRPEHPLEGRHAASERGVFWPTYLLREMTASTDARRRLVNVSDGSHTGDNLGLYPLLLRRTKVIIALDAGYDPDFSFFALAENVRLVEVDENTIIRINLDPLLPDADGLSSRPYAIGRIEYPDCSDDAHTDDGPWTRRSRAAHHGWLIYLRMCHIANAPLAAISYRAQNPRFPQEPSTNQFFGDGQFEAYRALGAHITKTLVDDMQRAYADGSEGLAQWCAERWAEENHS